MMNNILLLENTNVRSPWGSEDWIGSSHRKAPSSVRRPDGSWIPLAELIAIAPADVLGEWVVRAFGPRLPFLTKILEIIWLLSLQSHPGARQAEEGCARENREGSRKPDNERSYPDPYAKPELIVSLTRVWAMCGFRRTEAVLNDLGRIACEALARETSRLAREPHPDGLKRFITSLLTMPRESQQRVIGEVVAYAQARPDRSPALEWVIELNRQYPGDVGVVMPLCLTVVSLDPGQAMFVPPGCPHCYMKGLGFEVMGASDNVVRAALTQKHRDIPEFFKITDFSPKEMPILTPTPAGPCLQVYPTVAEEFALAVIAVSSGAVFTSEAGRQIEILICQGRADIQNLATGDVTHLGPGDSCVIPAALERYRIEGDAVLHRVGIPSCARA